MGHVSGDKARHNRERRKKIARRERTRAAREAAGKSGTAGQSKRGDES
jgi:hypothetical protein